VCSLCTERWSSAIFFPFIYSQQISHSLLTIFSTIEKKKNDKKAAGLFFFPFFFHDIQNGLQYLSIYTTLIFFFATESNN